MSKVERANASDAEALSRLIFASGPENLVGVFTGHQTELSEQQKVQSCIAYLKASLLLADGQFGFKNQYIIRQSDDMAGCVSFWQHPLSDSFSQATLDSLLTHFGGLESAMILQNSQHLSSLVVAPKGHQLTIGHLCVSSKYQRQGVAHRLLQHCEEKAQLLGKEQLILDVSIQNQRAISLYSKFGFKTITETQPSESAKQLGLPGHVHMHKTLNL